MMRTIQMMAFAVVLGCAIGAPADAQTPELLPEELEVELALSAAPEHVAREAAVYVLKGDGYRKVREGRNGFTCLVERGAGGGVEPICYDPEGTKTIVPRVLDAAALRMRGASAREVERETAEGFRTGLYRAPRRPGLAFMLSPHTRIQNPETGRLERVPPHLMIYAPYVQPEDLGLHPPGAAGFPAATVVNGGRPNAYLVVYVNPEDG